MPARISAFCKVVVPIRLMGPEKPTIIATVNKIGWFCLANSMIVSQAVAS
jgi:hypothetical protein